MELYFLGTGGGRFATITQKRRTGGIRIISNTANMHIDPGPGALVYSLEKGLDPGKLSAILISHCHPDHYTDGEILIEAMTGGAFKNRGSLICSPSVTSGNQKCGPAISRYHKSLLKNITELRPKEKSIVDDVTVEAVKAVHYDPDTIGFKLFFPEGKKIGYTSDTEYYEGIGDCYKALDLLILCVIRPRSMPLKWHMSTDDAEKIVRDAQPKIAVLTAFGMKMILNANPVGEAKYIEHQTGVQTLAAYDKMKINLNSDKGFETSELTKFF